MRLCLYNLHLGGTGRADPLAEVLLAQSPDLVLLTQASDPDVHARLAKRLAMSALTDGSAAALLPDTTSTTATFHHSVLQARTTPPGGLLELRIATSAGPLSVLIYDGSAQAPPWPTLIPLHAPADTPRIVAGTFEAHHQAHLAALLAAGYSDPDAGPTFPTQHPVSRPDRILLRGPTLRSARVETDRLATYASDHYPLVVDIDPPNGSTAR